jgi:solute carrier family 50 protein (sugar transporter)
VHRYAAVAYASLPQDDMIGAIQELNPLPMVAIWANCTAWLVYAYMKADYYVFFANEPGLLLGIYMTIICYGFAEPKVSLPCTTVLIFIALCC